MERCRPSDRDGARNGEIIVSISHKSSRNLSPSFGRLAFTLPAARQETESVRRVQGLIGQLQDEVRVLQEELARIRRALEQRQTLLQNSHQREVELRAAIGAEKR